MDAGKEIAFIKEASSEISKTAADTAGASESLKDKITSLVGKPTAGSVVGALGTGVIAAALASAWRSRNQKNKKTNSILTHPALVGLLGAAGGYVGGGKIEKLLAPNKKFDETTLLPKPVDAVVKKLITRKDKATGETKKIVPVYDATASNFFNAFGATGQEVPVGTVSFATATVPVGSHMLARLRRGELIREYKDLLAQGEYINSLKRDGRLLTDSIARLTEDINDAKSNGHATLGLELGRASAEEKLKTIMGKIEANEKAYMERDSALRKGEYLDKVKAGFSGKTSVLPKALAELFRLGRTSGLTAAQKAEAASIIKANSKSTNANRGLWIIPGVASSIEAAYLGLRSKDPQGTVNYDKVDK